jgi:Flp pilus assembly protein TadG
MIHANVARSRRRGAILPLVALCVVGLLTMVALAIDLSLLTLARAQCQHIADSSALAAARTLDGNASTYKNFAQALTNGQNAALNSFVLAKPVASGDVDIQIGTLDTITTSPYFQINNLTSTAGAAPTGNWGAAQSTVSGTVNFAFAPVFGITSSTVNARARAIHRPRDIAIILDFSGSMYFDSYLNKTGSDGFLTSHNPDPLVPKFGHYDPNTTATTTVNLVSSTDLPVSEGVAKQGNVTTTTNSGPPVCSSFATVSGGVFVDAFTAQTTLDTDNQPTINGGLKPWKTANNTGTGFAKTFGDLFGLANASNNTSRPTSYPDQTDYDRATQRSHPSNTSISGFTGFENTGYGTTGFSSWTFGPSYYGKTFFVWPPNPDYTPNPEVLGTTTSTNASIQDWRQRFFWMVRTDTGNKRRLDDNNVMWNSNGTMRPSGSSYTYTDPNGVNWYWVPNYDAILYWLKNTSTTDGPCPFPDSGGLCSGRILYYSSIPTTVSSAATDLEQRFWKEYIDQTLGVSTYTTTGTPTTTSLLSGYGQDFVWTDSTWTSSVYPKPTIGAVDTPTFRFTPNGSTSGSSTTTSINLSTNSFSWDPSSSTGTTNPQAGDIFAFTKSGSTTKGPYIVTDYNSSTGLVTFWPAFNAATSGNTSQNLDNTWRARFARFRPASFTGTPGSATVLATSFTLSGVPSGFTPQAGDRLVLVPASGNLCQPTPAAPSDPNAPSLTSYQVTAWNSATSTVTINTGLSKAIDNTWTVRYYQPAYMDYRDNPGRPKSRAWFGAMTFEDFIWNNQINWLAGRGRYMRSGTSYEAPMWILKAGINSALADIQKNHPNDFVTQIFFNHPQSSATDPDYSKRFNRALAPLGKQYARMQNSLFYPLSYLDTNGNVLSLSAGGAGMYPYTLSWQTAAAYRDVPVANGATCPVYAFAIAYNQFSMNANLVNYATTNGLASAPAGDAGGFGRRGARKLVVFETDGVANTTVDLTNKFDNTGGAYNCFYKFRMPVEYPTVSYPAWSTAMADCKTVASQLCALNTATNPGYSTTGRPVLIHCMGFGTLMEQDPAVNNVTYQATNFLQQLQVIGKTQQNDTDPLPDYKKIVGTSTQRIQKLKDAFTIIMQDGVQVSLFQ